MIDSIILFLGSLLANTMSAFAGGGAGLVQFPLLILLGLPFAEALATHKTASFALGIYSFFKKDMGQVFKPKNRTLTGYIIGGLVLFLIGIFNGSLTSGSGLFVTLWLILWFGMDYKMAVAYTLTLVGFFWNATGAISLLALGEPVKWSWLPILWTAAFFGGWLGAHLGHMKGNVWIKRGFVFVTLLSGFSLLWNIST